MIARPQTRPQNGTVGGGGGGGGTASAGLSRAQMISCLGLFVSLFCLLPNVDHPAYVAHAKSGGVRSMPLVSSLIDRQIRGDLHAQVLEFLRPVKPRPLPEIECKEMGSRSRKKGGLWPSHCRAHMDTGTSHTVTLSVLYDLATNTRRMAVVVQFVMCRQVRHCTGTATALWPADASPPPLLLETFAGPPQSAGPRPFAAVERDRTDPAFTQTKPIPPYDPPLPTLIYLLGGAPCAVRKRPLSSDRFSTNCPTAADRPLLTNLPALKGRRVPASFQAATYGTPCAPPQPEPPKPTSWGCTNCALNSVRFRVVQKLLPGCRLAFPRGPPVSSTIGMTDRSCAHQSLGPCHLFVLEKHRRGQFQPVSNFRVAFWGVGIQYFVLCPAGCHAGRGSMALR